MLPSIGCKVVELNIMRKCLESPTSYLQFNTGHPITEMFEVMVGFACCDMLSIQDVCHPTMLVLHSHVLYLQIRIHCFIDKSYKLFNYMY